MRESAEDPIDVGRAYDEIALEYDRLVADDVWMRSVLWDRYANLFEAGSKILEVGCGTGLDTLYLAARGVHVTGIDISPEMIGALRRKAAGAGLTNLVDVRVEDAGALPEWMAESFDGAFSAFSVLNTVDLASFAAGVYRLLRPGRPLLVHMLASRGIWKRLRTPGRPRQQPKKLAKTIGTLNVRHDVRPAAEVYRTYFRRYFRLRRAYGMGFLWPQGMGRRISPHIAYALGRLEPRLGQRRPMMNWGRFFVLELERRASEYCAQDDRK